MMDETECMVCTGLYFCGQVIITDQSSIECLNKQGMGSMRIYHGGSFLTRAKSGGRKPNATDLSFAGLGEENGDVVISPVNNKNNTQNATTASYDLFLTEEEAIYLCHLGLLKVKDEGTELFLTIEDLFERFSLNRGKRTFLIQYAVYSFFKKRKFVVKSGINFGMDYCIYRDSPEKVHAEMCVRVVDALVAPQIRPISAISGEAGTAQVSINSSKTCHLPYRNYDATYSLKTPDIHPDYVKEFSHGSLESSNPDVGSYYYYDNLPWKALSTITRVMPDVMKLGLLCYVLPNSWENFDEEHKENPELSEKSSIPAPIRYSHLFDSTFKKPEMQNNSRSFASSNPSLWPKTLDEMEKLWTVTPVSMMVRRLPVSNTKYPRVDVLQQRYRAGAKINMANQTPAVEGEKKKSKRKNFKKKVKQPATSADVSEKELCVMENMVNGESNQNEEISVEEITDITNIDVTKVNYSNFASGVVFDFGENSEEDGTNNELIGSKRSHEDMDNHCPPGTEHKIPAVENVDSAQISNIDEVLPVEIDEVPTAVAFKKARVRRDIEEIRGKSALSKKATIWELLSSPSETR